MQINKFAEIRSIILDWFLENREEYFFRQNRTPYKVWISETILQQTRMKAGIEKMEFFFSCFPDITSLANAKEEEVLVAFQGLGYYNRARNLHKGAKFILNTYKTFPEEYGQLLEVPSIGPYTAAAISSICYGKNIPVIDGNIKRIFSRLFELKSEISSPDFLNDLNSILSQMFNHEVKKPGDLNEAFMEFGQKICKVKIPQCKECLISLYCQANKSGKVNQYPVITKKKMKIQVNWKLYIIVQNNHVLLCKFNDFYFLKNHTGFPSLLEMENKILFSTHGDLKKNILIKHNSHHFENGPRHTITHHQISFRYCLLSQDSMEMPGTDVFWCPIADVEKWIVSSGLLKTWKLALHKIARGGT